MASIVAVITLVLGGLLTYRGFAVWNNCGYDCALFARAPSFTATFAILLGLLLLGLPTATGALLVSEAQRRRCGPLSEMTRPDQAIGPPPLSLPNYAFDRTAGIGCRDNRALHAAAGQLLR